MKKFWQEWNQETFVFPYCIGARKEKRPFYIYFNRYASSLLKSNPEYKEFYLPFPEGGEVDYLQSEDTKTIAEVEVDIVPLDAVIEAENIPLPNFLSVDTQGTTLDVLLGAEKTIKSDTIAMVLETGFHPLYQGEVLFGDICKWADERGFHFFKFLHVGQRSPYRCPLGFRGEGVDYYADSLYLRKVDSVSMLDIPDAEKYVLLHKLAFAAVVFHQTEYAIKALLKAREYSIDTSLIKEMEERVYYRMNRDMLNAYDTQPHVYPPTNHNQIR